MTPDELRSPALLRKVEREIVARCSFVVALERVFRVTPTPAQRVLYSVLFDGEAVPDNELGAQLFGFSGPVPPLARLTATLVKGARIGGTRLGALGGLHRAMGVPLSGLAPGEPAYAAFVAPDMRLGRQALNFVRLAMHASQGLQECLVSDGADKITIQRPDGHQVHFVCLPATAGGSALRGKWYTSVQFVEGAHFHDANFVVNDADLYNAVTVRVVPNGLILVESTPWVESGLMWDLYRENYGAPNTSIVARAPTRLVRTDDAALLAAVENEFARDPENAAQEYGAVFLAAGAGLFFDARAIDQCVDDTLPEEVPKGVASAGADWGFEADSCALACAHQEGEGPVLVGSIEEEQPRPGAPLKPSAVVGSFAVTLKDRVIGSVMSDAHYRQAVIEHLTPHGISLEDAPGGADGKLATWLKFRELVNTGPTKIRLPNHPRLIAQLKAVRSRPRPGGGLQIILPRQGNGLGGHGDVAAAAVLAVWQAAGAGGIDYAKTYAALGRTKRHL